jgi:hypothetical protein
MATATAKDAYSPSPRNPHPVRLAEDTWGNVGEAARAGQAVTANTWAEQVIEAALGYVRCHRGSCPGRMPPIPVTFGDLTGMTFGEAAALAAEAAESQHPRHEPVRIGAEPGTASSPLSSGTAMFREPGQ